MKPKILMIDDDEFFLRNYQKVLSDQYEVLIANNSAKGWTFLDGNRPDILLLDISMQTEAEGLQILPEIKKKYPYMPVIIVTNLDSHTIFSKAVEAGADDFFVKSDDLKALRSVISNLLNTSDLTVQADFIASSPAMKSILSQARKASQALAPVIINGETGSGKEVIARFIHQAGPRKNKPFVAINCGALTDTLLQDTFFGHEKGAFTGAIETSAGSFEQANGGTIFLDELEDLSPKGQAMLLRIIQEREVQRIGSKQTIKIDVRVITALKQPLKELVDAGHFREDLYYRLAVFGITVPPLRKRPEEIIPLIQYFMENSPGKNKKLTKGALLLLQSYTWPGNVRELENAIERAVVMSGRNELRKSDFAFLLENTNKPVLPYDVAKQAAFIEFRKNYIESALLRNKGNITHTADETGLSRQTIQQFLKENHVK